MKTIVLGESADYWKKGSGDSGIEIEGVDDRLIFFADEPHGFFVMFHPDYEVPYSEAQSFSVVEHTVGGEPMRVPTCCYLSRDMAWDIIEHFLDNHQKHPRLNWVDLYDIDFDHSF
ncbi:hypothetical protein [Spartinivicinus poritis]|uniref:Uncharacterized protein n=1 Tax=Spartinivicinus poritis TaxID=2994640 RepID=A0ABT5UGQ4_9GAMM|nr:hypothetical protein [Spartinivicinus sp. A2-2]MDE1465390.1 hypothetical protein [Spartinivicinus sp. A2-2]